MDKKSSSYNSNSCYWKLYKKSVRTIRFTKQKQHLQAAVKPTTDSPSATISPNTIEDRCIRLTRVDTVTIETPPNVSMETTDLSDRCPRVFKQSVAPITTPTAAAAVADDKKEAYQKVAVIQAKPKVTVVPIEGHENRIPAIISHVDGRKKTYIAESINGMSSEYIDRVGRIIRKPTNVGVHTLTITHDSFNDRVNDFINRTKNKFQAPSFIEASKGEENRLK